MAQLVPPMKPRPRPARRLAAIEAGLRDIYARLEGEMAGLSVRCKACGRCCHFAELDHVLYLSNVEAHYLCRGRRPSGGGTERCPFQKGRRCTAHARRALGCRTFFCDRRDREALQALYEAYLGEIKRLAEGAGVPWRYARLSEQLEAVREGSLTS